MVFANLQHHEKEAFFSLLDEYFTSRPEIFAGISGGGSHNTTGFASSPGGAAASAVHRALASNPEATSQLFSAGLKHGVPKSSPYSAAASDPEVNNAVGRVAAASLAFSSRNSAQAPPPPPTRAAAPPVAVKPASNLVSSRKFGDMDTSSAKGMFGSLVTSSARKNAPPPGPPPAPAAFAQKKSTFAPPPVRHATSNPAESPSPPPVQRRQQQQEEEEEEEEMYGEWADVLYDYESADAGDLNLKADQRVLVTERTSDDWWTGEVNGKKGLFPASYVKIL